MALTKIKLGKYLELYSEKCSIPNLTNDDVSGVNKEKEFFEPSNQVGSDTSKYKIVPPQYFACNLMHVGRDVVLPIAYNHSENNKIVSPAYFVFKFRENDEILSDYFFLYLKSDERDRYFWFNTDSSVRDGMAWEDFVNVDIELPSIEIQQKYVDVYNAMLANQQCYERGLEDLKLVCDAYIEDLRRNMPCEKIGPYIFSYDLKAKDSQMEYSTDDIAGVSSVHKKFIETKANTDGLSIDNYNVVPERYFSFNPNTARMGDKLPIALNDTGKELLVSAIYPVFGCLGKKLIPEYLAMFFSRRQFDRYARFQSWGSARETFDWIDMLEVKIPIPSIEIQRDIVDIYNAYITRKDINEKLKSQIKDICPILIKGSIEEAKKSKEA